MLSFLKPAKHIEKLPKEKIDPVYKRLRIQVFIGIFVGYAAYYLIRKNFSLAIPELQKLGYSKGELGIVLSAVSLSYGFSKFFMGNVSDRSNPKYFLSLGLLLSACTMFLFGFTSFATSSVLIMFILMFVNGWFQGMGWPPCGRTMVHWYSTKERGQVVSVWNIAHNIGGGLMGNIAVWGYGYFNDWHAYFYVPAGVALGIAIFIFLLMKDTPQSAGLPPIEEYKNDYPEGYDKSFEDELPAKVIFVEYILKNRLLWFIALANVFVYFIRYGVLDWAPTYLQEVKGFSIRNSGWAYAFYEYAAIPGTILCGIISDKVFNGRRAPAGMLFTFLTIIAIFVYWFNGTENHLIDNLALISVGFLIYGPVMLIGLHALEMVPKKAAGTAAGFTGLFGYLGGALFANAITGFVIDALGWNTYFILMIIAGFLAIIFMAFTWNHGGHAIDNNKIKS